MDKDLRSHVLWRSNEAESSVLAFKHPLGRAHVDQFEIAVSAYHDVLWFEISIDDSFLMESLKHMYEQGDVETGLFEWEDAYIPHDIEKILAFDIFSEKVDVVAIFERSEILHKKRTVFQTNRI